MNLTVSFLLFISQNHWRPMKKPFISEDNLCGDRSLFEHIKLTKKQGKLSQGFLWFKLTSARGIYDFKWRKRLLYCSSRNTRRKARGFFDTGNSTNWSPFVQYQFDANISWLVSNLTELKKNIVATFWMIPIAWRLHLEVEFHQYRSQVAAFLSTISTLA